MTLWSMGALTGESQPVVLLLLIRRARKDATGMEVLSSQSASDIPRKLASTAALLRKKRNLSIEDLQTLSIGRYHSQQQQLQLKREETEASSVTSNTIEQSDELQRRGVQGITL